MTAAQRERAATALPAWTERARRLGSLDPLFGEAADFLADEAACLDEDRFDDWRALLAGDLDYRMPMRATVDRDDGPGFLDHGHLTLDAAAASTLALRLGKVRALDRNPPPRFRRFVSNIVVHSGAATDVDLVVESYVLLLRNEFDHAHYDLLSGRRVDGLRREVDGLRLARRLVLLDQTVLGAAFMNVVL